MLDFFSGTGTTAEAVLNQNKKDNGKRKFVLVQISSDVLSSFMLDSNILSCVCSNFDGS